jgi:hypothetical protein
VAVHAGGWHTVRDRANTADPLLEPASVALSIDKISFTTATATKPVVTPQPAPFVPIHVNGTSPSTMLSTLRLTVVGPVSLLRPGVYTFGQPKVGNEEFVYALKRHTPCTAFYRITHNNDVVPSVPRKGYAHCGRRIFVSQDGLLIQVPTCMPHARPMTHGRSCVPDYTGECRERERRAR